MQNPNQGSLREEHSAVFVGSGAIGLRHLENWSGLYPESVTSLVARGRPQGLGAGVGYFESLDEALEVVETVEGKPQLAQTLLPTISWHTASSTGR